MFQKIFCRVFLWSHNFLLQVSRLLVSPGQSRAYHVCQQWNVLHFYNKILYSKRLFIFSNEIRVFNSIYTHLFHHFFFWFDIYLINILHFPYIITLAIILLMFLHNRFIVQRTSGSLLFFIQIYDIIIFWSITHYKRTMIMYVSSPSVLGKPGEAV